MMDTSKKYKLLYVDVPWKYKDSAKSGNRGAEFKYPCMTNDELCEMIQYIEEISDRDSVMYMWATGPMILSACLLMEIWGFQFRTVAFTWIKKTKNNKLFWGMGSTTRANPEFVLYGVRGKGIKRISASVHSVVESTIREHSRKPDEVRDRLVELYGDIPRIELFARERSDGWAYHGNEIKF